MKTILSPTDFSPNAVNAVNYAFSLARTTGAEVIVLHVYPLIPLSFSDLEIPSAGNEEIRQAAEIQMKKAYKVITKNFPEVKSQWLVMAGDSADLISDYSVKCKADLIVIGTTGKGALSRFFFGSTTTAVFKKAACHIIAVPHKAKLPKNVKLAVTTDLQPDTTSSVNKAVLFGKDLNAEINLVYFYEFSIDNWGERLEELASKLIVSSGYNAITTYVSQALFPDAGLAEYIKKEKPSIISVSAHNWKFPETIWNVSTTNQLLNNIKVPLLVLHVKKGEKAKRK